MKLAVVIVVCLIAFLPGGALSQFDEEPRRKSSNRQRIINAILKSRDKGDHYGVLGLRNNRYLRLEARSLTIIPKYFQVQIPELTLFYVSKKQIKKAFRARALAVHPDKTSDSRAKEAFNAIDKAAEILLDDEARAEYDRSITLRRQKYRAEMNSKLKHGAGNVRSVTRTCLKQIRRVLGPFTFPVVLVSFLIF